MEEGEGSCMVLKGRGMPPKTSSQSVSETMVSLLFKHLSIPATSRMTDETH